MQENSSNAMGLGAQNADKIVRDLEASLGDLTKAFETLPGPLRSSEDIDRNPADPFDELNHALSDLVGDLKNLAEKLKQLTDNID